MQDLPSTRVSRTRVLAFALSIIVGQLRVMRVMRVITIVAVMILSGVCFYAPLLGLPARRARPLPTTDVVWSPRDRETLERAVRADPETWH
jgi:hypothetical protein